MSPATPPRKKRIVSVLDPSKVLYECEIPQGVEASMELRYALEYAVSDGVKLEGADLRKGDFRNADLVDADLRGVWMTGANMRGANLTRADFTSAVMDGVDLTDADLTDAVGLETQAEEQEPPPAPASVDGALDNGGPASAISLRDYFAAKAMEGDIAATQPTHDWTPHADERARDAYIMADAMLKARQS